MPTMEKSAAATKEGWYGVLMLLASYRIKMPVREVMVFQNDCGNYICPRCDMTLDREFVAYCDRCGQRLGWKGYKKRRSFTPEPDEEASERVKGGGAWAPPPFD